MRGRVPRALTPGVPDGELESHQLWGCLCDTKQSISITQPKSMLQFTSKIRRVAHAKTADPLTSVAMRRQVTSTEMHIKESESLCSTLSSFH